MSMYNEEMLDNNKAQVAEIKFRIKIHYLKKTLSSCLLLIG
jgi:hypothetical protein